MSCHCPLLRRQGDVFHLRKTLLAPPFGGWHCIPKRQACRSSCQPRLLAQYLAQLRARTALVMHSRCRGGFLMAEPVEKAGFLQAPNLTIQSFQRFLQTWRLPNKTRTDSGEVIVCDSTSNIDTDFRSYHRRWRSAADFPN